jgi:hypothetical protein
VKKIMKNKEMYYLKVKRSDKNIVRTEILLTPLLIGLPMIIGILFICDWFYRGFLTHSSVFDGELILGIIILVSNIMFDIPFIRSLWRNFREN